MKIAFIVIVVVGLIAVLTFRSMAQKNKAERIAEAPTSFYDLTFTDINGRAANMSNYKGKYVLIVNVASECGNTPQYAALEELYTKYKDKLVIVGFPCNQFGGQEPGTEKEIAQFCTKNYGVTFPLASKVDVKGKDQHPVFTWLTSQELNGVASDKVEWNFHKFLVSPEGKWLKSYGASMDPLNGEIEKELK